MVAAIQRTYQMPCQNSQVCNQKGFRQDVTFESPQGQQRTARVFLPPSYHSQPYRKFPLLFMQDGQNLFERETAFLGQSWKLGATILSELCDNSIGEFVVVGIDNSGFDRIDEYTPWRDNEHERGGQADQYLDWIEHDILPTLRDKYRLDRNPENNIVGGSSLGALFSLYALTKRSHLFGGAMLMSGSWWWQNNSMHDYIRNTWKPRAGTKVWLDTGDAEKGRDHSHAMRETLRSVGLSEENGSLAFHEAPNGTHNEMSWGARAHLPLAYFFPPND